MTAMVCVGFAMLWVIASLIVPSEERKAFFRFHAIMMMLLALGMMK